MVIEDVRKDQTPKDDATQPCPRPPSSLGSNYLLVLHYIVVSNYVRFTGVDRAELDGLLYVIWMSGQTLFPSVLVPLGPHLDCMRSIQSF
jgi:hypothetical protein